MTDRRTAVARAIAGSFVAIRRREPLSPVEWLTAPPDTRAVYLAAADVAIAAVDSAVVVLPHEGRVS